MPMENEIFGSEKDGSINSDYCQYCYHQGAFTSQCSMEEMIEQCVPFWVEADPSMTPEKARTSMKEFFPTLKRWHD